MTRKRRRRNTGSVCLVCALMLGGHGLLYWVLTSRRLSPGVPHPAAAADRANLAPVRRATIRTQPRAIYPYSVIRGGAYSVTELEEALRADPLVAAHYAVFDHTQMRITQATHSAPVYVSYRQRDRVYWTRRKVALVPREPLLTDGVHIARARCGNRISLTPQEPVQTAEPSVIDMDRPEAPPAEDTIDSAERSDGFALPRLVHDIFPDSLGNWQPGGSPGGSSGSGMGSVANGLGVIPLPTNPEEQAPLGFRLPPPPGFTLPPPMPGVVPTGYTLPPTGPGFVWIQPILLPGPPEGVISLAPPVVLGLPPTPGLPPISGPPIAGPPIAGPPSSPAVPQSPSTVSEPAVSLVTGSETPWEVRLPPNAPLPIAVETPEPATAALLLCGVAILAHRRAVQVVKSKLLQPANNSTRKGRPAFDCEFEGPTYPRSNSGAWASPSLRMIVPRFVDSTSP